MRRDEIVKALRCFASVDNCPVDECNEKCPYWLENDKFDLYGPNAEISDKYQLCCAAADMLEKDEPVLHAGWMDAFGDTQNAKCSNCGEIFDVSDRPEPSKEIFKAFGKFYKFCPNCGARMDKEVNADDT